MIFRTGAWLSTKLAVMTRLVTIVKVSEALLVMLVPASVTRFQNWKPKPLAGVAFMLNRLLMARSWPFRLGLSVPDPAGSEGDDQRSADDVIQLDGVGGGDIAAGVHGEDGEGVGAGEQPGGLSVPGVANEVRGRPLAAVDGEEDVGDGDVIGGGTGNGGRVGAGGGAGLGCGEGEFGRDEIGRENGQGQRLGAGDGRRIGGFDGEIKIAAGGGFAGEDTGGRQF